MELLQVGRRLVGLVILVGSLMQTQTVKAQIVMTKYLTTYNQNFDALPASGTAVWENGTSTLIPGWTVQRTKFINTITANNGSNNTGGLMSYGATSSTERALGSIGSATAGEFAWGVTLQNKTGTAITSIDVNFWGEQWRVSNKTAPQHKITFWYAISSDNASFNLSPASDQNWIEVPGLTFRSPHFLITGTILDGNATANKQQLSGNLAITVPDGHYVMLRWKDADEVEADHALAIDDFTVSWNTAYEPAPMPVELASFKAKKGKDGIELTWQTASEHQNDYFLIERSTDGLAFKSIGNIKGQGTTKNRQVYTFTDKMPDTGTLYYRLKQVDEDESFTYSNVVQVYSQPLSKPLVYPTIVSQEVYIAIEQPQHKNQLTILNKAGRTVLTQHSKVGEQTYTLNVADLKAGSYFLVIMNGSGKKQVRRFVKN